MRTGVELDGARRAGGDARAAAGFAGLRGDQRPRRGSRPASARARIGEVLGALRDRGRASDLSMGLLQIVPAVGQVEALVADREVGDLVVAHAPARGRTSCAATGPAPCSAAAAVRPPVSSAVAPPRRASPRRTRHGERARGASAVGSGCPRGCHVRQWVQQSRDSQRSDASISRMRSVSARPAVAAVFGRAAATGARRTAGRGSRARASQRHAAGARGQAHQAQLRAPPAWLTTPVPAKRDCTTARAQQQVVDLRRDVPREGGQRAQQRPAAARSSMPMAHAARAQPAAAEAAAAQPHASG